jgi:hypothetical protein
MWMCMARCVCMLCSLARPRAQRSPQHKRAGRQPCVGCRPARSSSSPLLAARNPPPPLHPGAPAESSSPPLRAATPPPRWPASRPAPWPPGCAPMTTRTRPWRRRRREGEGVEEEERGRARRRRWWRRPFPRRWCVAGGRAEAPGRMGRWAGVGWRPEGSAALQAGRTAAAPVRSGHQRGGCPGLHRCIASAVAPEGRAYF